MKRWIGSLILSGTLVGASAQGLVGFNLGAATYIHWGDGRPLTTEHGAKAQLLAGPADSPLEALQPIGVPIDPIARGRFLGIGPAGEVAVPGIPGGQPASIGVLITANGMPPIRLGGVNLILKVPGGTVPAPSTVALGIVGGLMLVICGRRRSGYGR